MQWIIVVVISLVIGIMIGVGFANWKLSEIYTYQKNLATKNSEYYLLMTNWVKLLQHHKSVADCLREQGYNNIVIYGMGIVGKCLYDEVIRYNVDVAYGIDSEYEGNYKDLSIKKLTTIDCIEDVDAVIVTPFYDFNEIQIKLKKVTDVEILPIDEVIYYTDL